MAAPRETLALTGGPKAVTFPTEQQTALFKWPRYGPAEKKTLHDLIDTGKFYEELPLFESEWKAYTRSPFVKAHMNCSSALTSMYFALDLEPSPLRLEEPRFGCTDGSASRLMPSTPTSRAFSATADCQRTPKKTISAANTSLKL